MVLGVARRSCPVQPIAWAQANSDGAARGGARRRCDLGDCRSPPGERSDRQRAGRVVPDDVA